MMQDEVDKAIGRLEQAWARMRVFGGKGAPKREVMGEMEWRELVELADDVREVMKAGLRKVREGDGG